jgi:uncharacterized membrane protein YccC
MSLIPKALLPRIDRFTVLFAVNSFVAVMLALFVAFSLGLPRPFWAMTTVFIVSQPLSGAVRSKAVYRVFGTLLGAAAAVALVPNLAQAPVLLSLALALWVGGCLTVSLLDRTPRSYILMLAGYTAAIIGFPSVDHPEAIFDVAVSRVVEIGLGIVCATLVHSLVFPRPVGAVIQARLSGLLAEADRWALDVLKGAGAGATARDRRHLAAAVGEIRVLATHLPFDTSRLRETTAAVAALHERMLTLIPLLAGLGDRLGALGPAVDRETRAVLADTAGWIEAGAAPEPAKALQARLQTLAATRIGRDWTGLLTESLQARLAEAVSALAEAHALLAHVRAPDAPVSPEVSSAIAGAGRRPLHSDTGLALRSGLTAAVAILISCALWIGTGWTDGSGAAVFAAISCCFFASLDDPAPAIASFATAFLCCLPPSALYLFGVLPRIDGFPMLAAVLAPPVLAWGLNMTEPKRVVPAMAMILGFSGALSLQQRFDADFAGFVNGNLALAVGMLISVLVTRAMRSLSAEASARRLLRQIWAGLARLARRPAAPEPAAFAARLLDRLGLLAPRLAGLGDGHALSGVDALRDLRVGMNLVAVQRARSRLDGAARARLQAVLDGVGDHYAALAAMRPHAPSPELQARLDRALADLADGGPGAREGVRGLVGLRRGLFPDAKGFDGPPTPALEAAA